MNQKKKWKYVNIGKAWVQKTDFQGKPLAKPRLSYSINVNQLKDEIIEPKGKGRFVKFVTYENRDKGKENKWGNVTSHDYDLVAKYEDQPVDDMPDIVKQAQEVFMNEEDVPF